MKVAVITPYYEEPLEKLWRCHESVLAQTYPCTHIMVADGRAREEVSSWAVDHISLPVSHRDYGNTPRSIGGMSALNRGFEGLAYLDADNWLAPYHVESLVTAAARASTPLAYSDRIIVALNGSVMPQATEADVASRPWDTNCLFHTAAAARLIPLWGMMDPSLTEIGDQVLGMIAAQMGLGHVRTGERTIFYESNYELHYRQDGLEPPGECHEIDFSRVVANYSEARCTERLGFAVKLTP